MPRSSVATKTRGGSKRTVVKKAVAKKAVRKTTRKTTKKTSVKVTSATITNAAKKIKLTGTIKRNPLGHLLIEKELREAGFRGGISTNKKLLEAYSTDESIFSIRPQVVIQPKNRRDVEIAAAVVAKETKRFDSLSLTPRAAGTGLGGGSLTDSVVIDVCAHLRQIGDVTEKKGKITFTCEPGAMWRDVEKKLKEHDAYLPPYPASKDICSVGGSVANNAAGPDSLRHGHCADWVESMDVVLSDGHTYTIKPMTYREFKMLLKQEHEYARIVNAVFELISKNEKEIKNNKPETAKNSAGYPLWSVMPQGVAKFKKGEGTFDLTRLISGSQGTIGIITHITMRAIPIPKNTTLIAVSIFDLEDAARSITAALKYDPINVEIFDALTFNLALQNPSFFKDRVKGADYYKVMFSMYATYHVRYRRQVPEFTVLITLDENTTQAYDPADIAKKIAGQKVKARVVNNPIEAEMFWQIRRASYTLSKFQDTSKRPAAFLEDMTVPPENLSKFFVQVKALLKEFNVTAAVHGHGGNGHFHFYPLLDFTNKTTPALVEKMAEKFFSAAVKFHGNICGEHNDGIIRTPHLSKMFSRKMLDIFEQTEAIFDPDDIFNPGKKVNPRFDVKETMRTQN
ncbi:MAG: FAD-binding oxidoreductase [Candidatus Kaiserbacteria bacterium]|nr:FAD-binding oxidoreductase [Candidatus Kaiserbacteria bacterium]MCB9816104.1 FAD-binding oxidoreductase [Candidatus Nomurabacteria bacterium]